jgi:hypothetical protein
MVRHEVRATGRGTSRRGLSGRPIGHPACRPLRISPISFDTGTRRASNPCSGEPGEVPDNEVNADLGIPSLSLVRVQGLTHAEVAGLLAVSVKTVQRRLNAAVLALEALAELRPDAASTGESPGD